MYCGGSSFLWRHLPFTLVLVLCGLCLEVLNLGENVAAVLFSLRLLALFLESEFLVYCEVTQ